MRIADLIHGGDLGDIRHVNISNIGASWNDPASRPKGDWWSDAAMGGGRLGANGSHQVDMVRWWLGEPAAVIGQALTVVARPGSTRRPVRRGPQPRDDLAYLTMEMRSGALAQIFMSRRRGCEYGQRNPDFRLERNADSV